MTHIRIRLLYLCSAVVLLLFLRQQQAVCVSVTGRCESSNFVIINCARLTTECEELDFQSVEKFL